MWLPVHAEHVENVSPPKHPIFEYQLFPNVKSDNLSQKMKVTEHALGGLSVEQIAFEVE